MLDTPKGTEITLRVPYGKVTSVEDGRRLTGGRAGYGLVLPENRGVLLRLEDRSR